MNSARPDEIRLTFQRFIDWAHEQGWIYVMEPGYLRCLERFLQARGVQRLDEVDSVLLAEHQRCLAAHKSRLTVNNHLSTWRSLWRYLLKEQLVERDATQGLQAFALDYYVPHLHSVEELRRIEQAAWKAVGQAKDRRQRFVRQTLYAAFCLLRDAGLRIGEVRRLDVNHYDPRTRVLHLEGTKFLKTRDIPLPRSTGRILEKYLQHRQSVVGTWGKSTACFVSPRGYRLRARFFQSHFQQLLRELGLWQSRRRQGRTVFGDTNPHSLRHSFAVRTLERWHLEGRNVEHLLPLLSGYLGHVRVSYTKRYLHMTPLLRELASQRFAALVLPELDHWETPAEHEPKDQTSSRRS